MSAAVERTKVEILLDAPLVRIAVAIVERFGTGGYTLFPASGGAGSGGRWSDDQVTSADSKVLVLTIASAETARAIIAEFEPLLETHGIIVMTSRVQVVRANKF